MLPRRARIPGQDIKDLSARTMGRSNYFVLKSAENGLLLTRFAVIVGSNVDRRAYRRHTLKRRAIPVLRRLIQGGRDVILIVLPAANRLPRAEFRAELEKITQNPI